jgi:hypothetical protein
MKDGLPGATVENFWDNSDGTVELITNSEDTWTPAQQEHIISDRIQHGIGQLAIDYSDFTEFRLAGVVESCVFEQQFLLSPMVLYQDLTQKYSNVLEMCESLLQFTRTGIQ